MKIKKNNFFLVFLILFLSSFSLVACGNSTNTAKPEADSNQQEIDTLFKKAEVLFKEDKNVEAYKIFKQLAEQGDAKSQNALESVQNQQQLEHLFLSKLDT